MKARAMEPVGGNWGSGKRRRTPYGSVHTHDSAIIESQRWPCPLLVGGEDDGMASAHLQGPLETVEHASHLPTHQSCRGPLAGKLPSSPTCAKPSGSPLVHALDPNHLHMTTVHITQLGPIRGRHNIFPFPTPSTTTTKSVPRCNKYAAGKWRPVCGAPPPDGVD
jgi:hypothetical protein